MKEFIGLAIVVLFWQYFCVFFAFAVDDGIGKGKVFFGNKRNIMIGFVPFGLPIYLLVKFVQTVVSIPRKFKELDWD